MHLDFALPVDGDLLAGIKRHDKQAQKSVMDYSYHVPLTEYNDKVTDYSHNVPINSSSITYTSASVHAITLCAY